MKLVVLGLLGFCALVSLTNAAGLTSHEGIVQPKASFLKRGLQLIKHGLQSQQQSRKTSLRTNDDSLLASATSLRTYESLQMNTIATDSEAYRELYPELVNKIETGNGLDINSEYQTVHMIRKGGAVLPDKPVFVKVRGPFDSGTNYLHELLKLNGITDHEASYGASNEENGGWKHWPLQWEPYEMAVENRFNILLARNPLSWFAGNKKATYDIKCIQAETNAKSLYEGQGACTFELYHIRDKVDNPTLERILGPGGSVEFDSIVDIWNLYYSGYLETKTPSLIVRYEDLLANPELVVRRIADEVGVKMTEGFRYYKIDAKHGASRSFDEAKEYNLKKLFLSNYDISAVYDIMKKIDKDALKQLKYTLTTNNIDKSILAEQAGDDVAPPEATTTTATTSLKDSNWVDEYNKRNGETTGEYSNLFKYEKNIASELARADEYEKLEKAKAEALRLLTKKKEEEDAAKREEEEYMNSNGYNQEQVQKAARRVVEKQKAAANQQAEKFAKEAEAIQSSQAAKAAKSIKMAQSEGADALRTQAAVAAQAQKAIDDALARNKKENDKRRAARKAHEAFVIKAAEEAEALAAAKEAEEVAAAKSAEEAREAAAAAIAEVVAVKAAEEAAAKAAEEATTPVAAPEEVNFNNFDDVDVVVDANDEIKASNASLAVPDLTKAQEKEDITQILAKAAIAKQITDANEQAETFAKEAQAAEDRQVKEVAANAALANDEAENTLKVQAAYATESQRAAEEVLAPSENDHNAKFEAQNTATATAAGAAKAVEAATATVEAAETAGYEATMAAENSDADQAAKSADDANQAADAIETDQDLEAKSVDVSLDDTVKESSDKLLKARRADYTARLGLLSSSDDEDVQPAEKETKKLVSHKVRVSSDKLLDKSVSDKRFRDRDANYAAQQALYAMKQQQAEQINKIAAKRLTSRKA